MSHVFSDLEGLRIAAEMERRGEDFYRRAARVSRNPEAVALLNALAGDEVVHRNEFNRLYEEAMANHGPAAEEPYDSETSAYLSAIAADVVFPGGLMALRQVGFENPAAVLMTAISSEKDSVMFYTELANHAHDEAARSVFLEIARQERGHMLRLERQLSQLNA